MNLWAITGNLGKDVEVRYAQSGTAIASFTVAVAAGFGEKKQTVWVKCALFGKRAESGLIQYLTKGQQVAVTGELSLNKWQTQDGKDMTDLQLNVGSIDLVGGKKEGGQAPKQSAPQINDGFDSDSAIPF